MSDVSLWQTACKVGVVYNGKIVTNLSRIVNSASVGGVSFQLEIDGGTIGAWKSPLSGAAVAVDVPVRIC